jgi:hypothetical protein
MSSVNINPRAMTVAGGLLETRVLSAPVFDATVT